MTTPFELTSAQLSEPLTAEDHLTGTPTAPVSLVEYGDFQCPYCGAAHPVVQELLRMRPGVVRFAFRHFPLTNVHPYADLAAEVAEAAGARGLFWAMHDWLFENQDLIEPASISIGVRSVNLPITEIEREYREHVWGDRVRRDFVSGVRSGVNGTPTFYVNGVRHDLGNDLAGLLSAVDIAAES